MKILNGSPPYRAWHFNKVLKSLWGIQCVEGYNCFSLNGAVFLPSQQDAEYIIRQEGFEPQPAIKDVE